MSAAFPLITARIDRVGQILSEVEALDGELSPDLEAELDQLLQESEDAILDCAARAKEYQLQAERLQDWRRQAGEKMKRLESQSDRLKAKVTLGMQWWVQSNGKKTLKSPDELVRVTLAKGKGRVEVKDPALDKESYGKGYTEAQVTQSSIPRSLFKAVVLWSLQTDVVRAYLEEGQEVPGVELVVEPNVRISVAGGE